MGTPGHMNHPFDIDWVNTGEDLIDFFISAGELLQTKPASIKWDGINVSFKLVTGEDGRKGFRMDRGTSAPESVIGMTAEDAYSKWPEGHGMPVAIEKLLAIFNEALPRIVPELKALGMWDDPTKFFNTEYMEEGGTNVVKYDRNMLAIHGINQFYEKKAQAHRIRKGIGMDRPGMERPISPDTGKPIKNVSVETNYDRKALDSLIQKVQPIATKFDFSILGDTPTENVAPIDLETVLDTSFPIHLTEGDVQVHSIREWLQDAVNPRDKKIATKQGRTPGALSKEIYVAVLNKTPLIDLLESQEDVKLAVNGAIFYQATKELGNAVKKSLKVKGWEGPLADVSIHEGIVLRDPKFGPKPVKITGEFILEGMVSSFGSEERQELAKQAPADLQVEKSKLALLAGGFKPPHKGHLEMVKFYNQQVGPNGKVIILLGSGGKEPRTINGRTITSQDSMEIWDVYLKNEPSIPWPSNKIEFQNVEGAGPIAPIIDYVREQAPEDQIILLGAGEKDEDRWPNIMANPRNNPRGLEIETTPAPNMLDDKGMPLSARNMRASVENGDLEAFKSYIPDSSMQFAEKIFTTLGNGTIEEPQEEPQEQLQEASPLPLGIFLGLVEEALNKKLLNEGPPSWLKRAKQLGRPILPAQKLRQIALNKLGLPRQKLRGMGAPGPAIPWPAISPRIEDIGALWDHYLSPEAKPWMGRLDLNATDPDLNTSGYRDTIKERIETWVNENGVPDSDVDLRHLETFIVGGDVPFPSHRFNMGGVDTSVYSKINILSWIENKYFVNLRKAFREYGEAGAREAFAREWYDKGKPDVLGPIGVSDDYYQPEFGMMRSEKYSMDSYVNKQMRSRPPQTAADAVLNSERDKLMYDFMDRVEGEDWTHWDWAALGRRYSHDWTSVVDRVRDNKPYWKLLEDMQEEMKSLDKGGLMDYQWKKLAKRSQQEIEGELQNLVDNSWMQQNKEKWAAPAGSLELAPTEGVAGPLEREALTNQQKMDRWVSQWKSDLKPITPTQADIARIGAPISLGGTMPNPGESGQIQLPPPLPRQISQTSYGFNSSATSKRNGS